MDFADIQGWLGLAKNSVELLRGAAALLPSGEGRAEIERRLKEADDMLKRSDAKLARDLGLKLCDCTFPPQIMLWKEAEKAHICPNPECGRKIKPGMNISPEAIGNISRSGPLGWMG